MVHACNIGRKINENSFGTLLPHPTKPQTREMGLGALLLLLRLHVMEASQQIIIGKRMYTHSD
jgi:hypothetical protein